jgi:beta-galactosidase/beta-glucuronidase
MEELSTEYGEKLNRNCVLPLHPNPLFERQHWLSLNGVWDFDITKNVSFPESYTKSIVVPFSVETSLSGVNQTITSKDYLHYHRFFSLPTDFPSHNILLHFDAVDQIIDVFINGKFVFHHESGYTPFAILLTNLPRDNSLSCIVRDNTDSDVFPRGKQSSHPGGIFYHPTSGIWGNVWIEGVPETGYIKGVKITPDFDEKKFVIQGDFSLEDKDAKASLYYQNHLVDEKVFSKDGSVTLDARFEFHPWSNEDPALYTLKFVYHDDVVSSYCALRKFSMVDNDGLKYFALNNKPTFLSAVLDQGYYPESGLTAPSEEAMLYDLNLLKRCGFNAVRKHIKIEPMRWYYLCDKLGLLVIQDMVNGGSKYNPYFIMVRPFISRHLNDKNHLHLGRKNKDSRIQFVKDMKDTVNLLYNVPSICMWTLFNEAWGQFDSVANTKILSTEDPTRLIDSNSGWYDSGAGNCSSYHIYFRRVHLRNDKKRILSLSEFGGYSYLVEGHNFSKKSFGYKKFYSLPSLNQAITKMYKLDVIRNIEKSGLCISVLTQLSDVEEEINGLVTYDRKCEKINPSLMKDVNNEVFVAFAKTLWPKE